MIQISNPIEPTGYQVNGSNSGNNNLDSANRPDAAGGPAGVFSQKKNRLGVFAKLLEGLSAKLTRETGESGNSETEEPSGAGKSASKLFNAKKTRHPSLGIDFSDAEDMDTVFYMLPWQEHGAADKAGEGDLLPVDGDLLPLDLDFSPNGVPVGENPLWGINPQEMDGWEVDPQNINSRDANSANSKEGFSLRSTVKEEEKQDSSAETENRPIGSEGEKQGLAGLSAERAKNARNANTLNVPFREMEAESLKNQSWDHLVGMNSALRAQGDGTENGLSPEPRGKKGRDRLNIEVRDLRTGNIQRGITASPELDGASKELGTANVKMSSIAEIEIPVDLSDSLAGEKAAGEPGDPSLQGRTFEDLLAAQLRGDLSTDIVRDASVVIRNGGEGTIRLSLRPASLGDVKIHLEMAENKITGHILLESNEALRAFQRELPVLEKAFRDSGYSETSLDMSLAQNGDSGSQGQRQEGNFLSQSVAASLYDSESFSYSPEPETPGSGALVGSAALPASPGITPVYLLV